MPFEDQYSGRVLGLATEVRGILGPAQADGDDPVVGIAAVEALEYEHEAAVRTWLRFSGRRIGFLFNFNTVQLEEGMRRYDM